MIRQVPRSAETEKMISVAELDSQGLVLFGPAPITVVGAVRQAIENRLIPKYVKSSSQYKIAFGRGESIEVQIRKSKSDVFAVLDFRII